MKIDQMKKHSTEKGQIGLTQGEEKMKTEPRRKRSTEKGQIGLTQGEEKMKTEPRQNRSTKKGQSGLTQRPQSRKEGKKTGARLREEDGSYTVRGSVPADRETATYPQEPSLDENSVAKAIVEAAFQVHTALGPGLLESVYEVVLAHELRQNGYRVDRQVPIPIVYKEIRFKEGFRADLIVAASVVVELKSVDSLAPVHSKQLLTQLRLTKKRLGLLINFGALRLKDNVRRVVNGLTKPAPEQ